MDDIVSLLLTVTDGHFLIANKSANVKDIYEYRCGSIDFKSLSYLKQIVKHQRILWHDITLE